MDPKPEKISHPTRCDTSEDRVEGGKVAPHDFEDEARATFESCHVGDNMIQVIAAKLREVDARARTEGEADGYRRGVEDVCGWLVRQDAEDMFANDMRRHLRAIRQALLPPEPAKARPMWTCECGASHEANPHATITAIECGCGRQMSPEQAKSGCTNPDCFTCGGTGTPLPEPAKAECTCARNITLEDEHCPIHGARR